MSRVLINTVLAIAAAMALASCGERPPRTDPEGRRGITNATPQHPMYERTLEQGEAERIGN